MAGQPKEMMMKHFLGLALLSSSVAMSVAANAQAVAPPPVKQVCLPVETLDTIAGYLGNPDLARQLVLDKLMTAARANITEQVMKQRAEAEAAAAKKPPEPATPPDLPK
jgi:hypothetical protein